MKIVLFMLLGLGAAALVAEQSSSPLPAQEPGANQAILKPRLRRQPPPPFAWPVLRPIRSGRLLIPPWFSAAARFLARIAVFAMDPMLAVAKAVPI